MTLCGPGEIGTSSSQPTYALVAGVARTGVWLAAALLSVVLLAVTAGAQSIRGSVRSGNEPIVGATVRLLELDREQRTDAQGQFSFSNVPNGTYRVYAGGILGYVAATDTVRVSGGEVSVSFELVASAVPLKQIVISRLTNAASRR